MTEVPSCPLPSFPSTVCWLIFKSMSPQLPCPAPDDVGYECSTITLKHFYLDIYIYMCVYIYIRDLSIEFNIALWRSSITETLQYCTEIWWWCIRSTKNKKCLSGICFGIWSAIKDNQKKVFSEANTIFSKLKWCALFFSEAQCNLTDSVLQSASKLIECLFSTLIYGHVCKSCCYGWSEWVSDKVTVR